MPSPKTLQRHYLIPEMSFEQFWDLCSHFQTIFPEYRHALYSIDGHDGLIALDEPNVGVVAQKIKNREDRIRKISVRLYTNRGLQNEAYRICEFRFRPQRSGDYEYGLTFYADEIERARYFQFEDKVYETFEMKEGDADLIEFGQPCELLAMVIDIRGFSLFCEQPNIESPYTCGLMSAFYSLIERALDRYPPNMIKFLGDGVLAVWETTARNRDIIVNLAVTTAIGLNNRWKGVRRSPQFGHGVPEGTGAGISFGLASHLSVGNDYLGRPINIASRLCSACPPDRIYVDRAVPSLPLHLRKEELGIIIKPYGRHQVWGFFFEDQEEEKENDTPQRRLSSPY